MSTAQVFGLFESNPAHVDGMLTACVGDQISLTCSHNNLYDGITVWTVSPPVSCMETIVHSSIRASQCGPFTFQDTTELTGDTTALLSTTAIATANVSMNGAVVECRDSTGRLFNQIGNTTLRIVGI